MTAISQTLKQWRWYQWVLAVLALLYVVYVALSYLYLPGKLKDVVQNDVAQLLGRDIRVERIAFNPFTLSLTVDRFALADRPQLPLVAFNQLFVNVDAWGSLFGWQIRLSDVRLDAPQIAIERRRQDFNFSDILARFPEDTSQPPQPKAKLALQIDNIRILSGLFSLDDISGATPAHSRIDDITVGVQNLYLATGDEKLNPFSLDAAMPHGGKLGLKGQYRADPLKIDANIQATDIHLEALKDFIANVVPVQLNSGRLSLQTDVEVAMNKTLQAQVRNGRLTLSDLAVDDASAEPPLLRGKLLEVQGIAMDLAQQRFHIDSVALDGFETDQWLDADGAPRVRPLLASSEKPAEAAPPATATPAARPWDVSVGSVTMSHSRVGFQDRRDGLNASQQVNDLNLTLSDIHLVDGAQVPFQLNATVNDGGELQVDGRITPMPFDLDLHYQLQGLALAPFNPYVEQLSFLHLKQGTLKVDGTVTLASADPLPLTLDLDLNAGIDGLQADDTRTGKTVLQWKALQLDKLQLDLAGRNVAIARVALDTPDIDVEMGADKQMNLATLMKPAPAATAETANAATQAPAADAAAPAQPWQVAIDEISLQHGSTRFQDASVKPTFKTGLYDMAFQLNKLTSAGDSPANFSLNSKIDKYAPFNVKGTLAPLQQQPGFAFTSQLRGLEMPALSPYTGTFIGYNLESGKLELDLKYELKAHKLSGNNTIVARQLYLGDEVKSDQAVNAPVALGLALLRDASGVIDLDVGVSGDLDEPGFSVSGIVLKALMNIIVKAATSPFQLLGSLVGGAEDLGSITFDAGSAMLGDDSQDKLRQLVQALSQRPQLAVTVHGNASANEDATALQQQRVLGQIATQRKIPVTQLQAGTLLQDKANRNVLEDLNDALKLASAGDRKAALQTQDPKLNGDPLTQAVYRQMLADVVAKQVISDQDLLNLADQRALAIKQFLVESAGLDHSRAQLLKTRKDDLKGRVCELGVEAG